MAVTTAVLSGNITDLAGDFNLTRAGSFVLAIEANTDGSLLLDTSGNRVMGGAKRVTVDKTSGAYTVTLVATDSTDVIPSGGRLYRAYLQYPSGIPGAGNIQRHSGWFELTADGSLSDADKWPGLEVTAVSQALVDSIGDMSADVETRHAAVMGVVATTEGLMTSVLGSGGTFDTELSATYGATLIGSVTTAANDQTANIQAALTYGDLTLRGGTFRVDGTVTLETSTLRLAPLTKMLRVTAAASTDPVVWVNKNGGVLCGYGLLGSTIETEKRAPLGVVCVGGLGTSDATGRAASYNVVRDLEIKGMTDGGQTTGSPDYALYLCNNEIGGLTSYFNRFSGLRLRSANVGVCLQGYANGNQFTDIHLYQVGNNKSLDGAGIKLMTGNGVQVPIENKFEGVFHHGSTSATTIFLDGYANYNTFTGIVPEQGGASAQVLRNSDDTVFGCIVQATANVNAGDTLTANFKALNTYTRGADHYGKSSTVTTLASTTSTTTTATVTGSRTHGAYLEDAVTITGLTEFAKTNFLKVTVPASAGSYRVHVDVQMGSTATNASGLQTTTGGEYLLVCTTGAVTVVEISTYASAADTYIAPVVSGRDVTFAAQYGTNGGATATGIMRARYRVPTAVTVTHLSSTSTGTTPYREHFIQRSANGSTANRPASGRGPGDRFWDTTIKNPLYWDGSAWRVGATRLSTTGVLDFPSIAAQSAQELTVTITGAAAGDLVILGPPAGIEAGLVWNGYVSAANTVKVRVSNITAAAIDPASASWAVTVVR